MFDYDVLEEQFDARDEADCVRSAPLWQARRAEEQAEILAPAGSNECKLHTNQDMDHFSVETSQARALKMAATTALSSFHGISRHFYCLKMSKL